MAQTEAQKHLFGDEKCIRILCIVSDSDTNSNVNVWKNGSRQSKAGNEDPDRKTKVMKSHNDNLSSIPNYSNNISKRCYRPSSASHLYICHKLKLYMAFFSTKRNASGKVDLNVYQKYTAADQKLGYGTCFDTVYEYVRMDNSTERA